MNKKPYDNFWGNLVATVCEEFQDGTLEFSDAVEDLLILVPSRSSATISG